MALITNVDLITGCVMSWACSDARMCSICGQHIWYSIRQEYQFDNGLKRICKGRTPAFKRDVEDCS